MANLSRFHWYGAWLEKASLILEVAHFKCNICDKTCVQLIFGVSYAQSQGRTYGIWNLVSFYISTAWWVSLLVDQWVPEGTCSQVLRLTSVDSLCFESIKIIRVKINWNCNFAGLLHYPFKLQPVLALFGHQFSTFENYFIWLRITDEGSVPEVRIWSILLI